MLDEQVECTVAADPPAMLWRQTIDVFDRVGDVKYRIRRSTGSLLARSDEVIEAPPEHKSRGALEFIFCGRGLGSEEIRYYRVAGGDIIRHVRPFGSYSWWDVVSSQWEQLEDDFWPSEDGEFDGGE